MYKKIQPILIISLSIALIFTMFKACENPKLNYIQGETVIIDHWDTTPPPPKEIVHHWHTSTPIDTLNYDSLGCSFTYLYSDSIADTNQTIYYKAVGILDSIQLSYKLKIPLRITHTIEKTRIDTIKAPKLSIYGGVELGYKNISPFVSVQNKRQIYSVRYGLNDKSISIGLGIRLFQK